MIISFDIETCPIPLDLMSPQQIERLNKELARQARQDAERQIGRTDEDRSRLVRSTHPMLGWICCIAVVRYDERSKRIHTPKSYTAGHYAEEPAMLERFWADLQKVGMAQWVSFNGKRFDSPFLRCRTLTHSLRITNLQPLHTHPFQHRPHADLMTIFRPTMTLADLCALLGVESPKDGFCGADVAQAVEEGRIVDVAEYCEGDVIPPLKCYLKARHTIA